MSDETTIVPSISEMENAGEALDVVQETVESFLETASVDRVFGEPIKNGDTLIIPAAELFTFLGFGAGFGGGTSVESKEGTQRGGGGGGGGGGRILSRPVAVVVASPEGVRVVEVVDPTKIALAAITAAGFMVGMFLRMVSPKRAMRNLDQE